MTDTPSRGRGSRMPRHTRRLQLLKAARDVFVAAGYHASAMDDIAERAGVSKPVLYQHFSSKYDLYLALVDQNAKELTAGLKNALESEDQNRDKVTATMSAFFEFIDRESESFRLIFESDLTTDPEVQRRINDVNTTCAGMVAEVFQTAAGIPEDDAQLLGIALGGMASTTARYWLHNGRQVPREHAVNLLSALLWRGMRGLPIAGS